MKSIFSLFCLLVMQGAVATAPVVAPWGKDAEMVHASCKEIQVTSPSPLSAIGKTIIRFHQEIISPIDGTRSHYVPCSSSYALQAMKKYGFFKGYIIGCDRLMRENSGRWVYYTKEINGQTLKTDAVP